MKVDSSTSKHGDVSPITGSLDAPAKPPRKSEPSQEELHNFARVVPAQFAYISFSADGRYQPVRPVSTRTLTAARTKGFRAANSTAERYAGGGSIVLLQDLKPGEPHQYIAMETRPPQTPAIAQAAGGDGQPQAEGPEFTEPPRYDATSSDLDTEGEAPVPPSFEVRRSLRSLFSYKADFNFSSIRSTTTSKKAVYFCSFKIQWHFLHSFYLFFNSTYLLLTYPSLSSAWWLC
jgi:hypothetical protein